MQKTVSSYLNEMSKYRYFQQSQECLHFRLVEEKLIMMSQSFFLLMDVMVFLFILSLSILRIQRTISQKLIPEMD